MAGYLIAVSYTTNSLHKTCLFGVDDGMFANQTDAMNAAKSTVIAYRAALGDVPTNVLVLVSATR